MARINLDQNLYERAAQAAAAAGYSSTDEFIAHCVDLELKRQRVDEAESQVADQLRGLGYLK
jgi:hypothetical protein